MQDNRFERNSFNSCIVELWTQLEQRDRRLSLVESNLKQVQGGLQIWSGIVQDGFADLSVQVKAATTGRRISQQIQLLETKTTDISELSDRLSKVEQQMQTMEVKAQQRPEVGELISQAMQQLQELQAHIQEVQFKFQQETQVCHDKLRQQDEMVKEIGLRLERSQSVPSISAGAAGLPACARLSLLASVETSPAQLDLKNRGITSTSSSSSPQLLQRSLRQSFPVNRPQPQSSQHQQTHLVWMRQLQTDNAAAAYKTGPYPASGVSH